MKVLKFFLIAFSLVALQGCRTENTISTKTENDSADVDTPHGEHLRDLGWLIGKWENKDENSAISNQFQWSNNKNFIDQRFAFRVTGDDLLEGNQIIGWDPDGGKIRSWIFDSDGGFGEGAWSNQEGSWYVNLNYTLEDGRKASSVNNYKKIDDNSYTFSSTGRDVDGEVLPDIDSVTFVRVR